MKPDDWLGHTNRQMNFGSHTIRPDLPLKSSAVYALTFQASRRRLYVAQLVTEIVEAWADAWLEQLGETDRRMFLSSIPRPARGIPTKRPKE